MSDRELERWFNDLRRDVEKEIGFAYGGVRNLLAVDAEVPEVRALATAMDNYLTYRTGYTDGVPVRQL
jgi:hypothetical protein